MSTKDPNVFEYMWLNHFKPIWDEIPGGRAANTVQKLRKLILCMYKTGYNPTVLGRFIEKDHSTVIHHLRQLGVLSRRGEPKFSRQELTQRALDKAKKATDLAALKDELSIIRSAQQMKQVNKNHERRMQVKQLRNKAFAMYKKGLSYLEIQRALNLPMYRVQNLLVYHPEYRTLSRVKERNRRAVIQLSKDGKEVARFKSLTEATKAVGIARNSITLVCRGRTTSAAGYVWKYA